MALPRSPNRAKTVFLGHKGPFKVNMIESKTVVQGMGIHGNPLTLPVAVGAALRGVYWVKGMM